MSDREVVRTQVEEGILPSPEAELKVDDRDFIIGLPNILVPSRGVGLLTYLVGPPGIRLDRLIIPNSFNQHSAFSLEPSNFNITEFSVGVRPILHEAVLEVPATLFGETSLGVRLHSICHTGEVIHLRLRNTTDSPREITAALVAKFLR